MAGGPESSQLPVSEAVIASADVVFDVVAMPQVVAHHERAAPGSTWCLLDQMTERALPTVMRKVIAHAMA